MQCDLWRIYSSNLDQEVIFSDLHLSNFWKLPKTIFSWIWNILTEKCANLFIDPKQSEEKYFIGFRSQCDFWWIYFVQLPKTVAHTSKFLEYFSWMCWFMVEICSKLVRNLREIKILVKNTVVRGKYVFFKNFDAITCKRLFSIFLVRNT